MLGRELKKAMKKTKIVERHGTYAACRVGFSSIAWILLPHFAFLSFCFRQLTNASSTSCKCAVVNLALLFHFGNRTICNFVSFIFGERLSRQTVYVIMVIMMRGRSVRKIIDNIKGINSKEKISDVKHHLPNSELVDCML